MREIIDILNEKLIRLKKLTWEAEKSLENAPLEGRIKVSPSGSWVKAYLVTKETGPAGKYINCENADLLKLYCQRDYEKVLIKKCQKLIKTIEKFFQELPSELAENEKGFIRSKISLDDYLAEKNPVRRRFLKNSVLSDKEYAEMWRTVSYKGKAFERNATEFITDRGERVRSKSEMLIANKLAAKGIPYRYEFPYKLRDHHGFRITVYPDFTILNVHDRREIILEHFGRMDDPEYVKSVLSKLELYGRNGIFPGKRFFFTTETSEKPFNMRLFEKQLATIFQ